ncbi:hypothetical protein [Shewanella frigidimarina]|uniref:hypothetical protein n=1 Tax=Shewanella frigidimarina TaxID=56812 RepID=UPI003D794A9D
MSLQCVADDSELLMDFEELGLIDLVVNNNGAGLGALPEDLRNDGEAMAEAIENNVRKTIVDENPVKPSNNRSSTYPSTVDSAAKQALYDNFSNDETLTAKIDTAVRETKKAEWLGDRFKE